MYLDLDGTLLGPGASLLRGAEGRFALDGVRALQACARADVEVMLYSGRRQSSVFEIARLIGAPAFCFDVGCGLVIDGELEWLTGGVVQVDHAAEQVRHLASRCPRHVVLECTSVVLEQQGRSA